MSISTSVAKGVPSPSPFSGIDLPEKNVWKFSAPYAP